MKRPSTQWIFNFAVLAAVVLLLAGAGWLFAKAIETGATFLGAVIAALVTVVTVLLGRSHERRKEAEATRRRELGQLYEKLAGVAVGQVPTGRAQEKLITDFLRKALVYSSPAVIKAFSAWRDNLHDDSSSTEATRASMLRFEALVKAMRKDLGISSWMLDEGDLLRVGLVDFDQEFGEPAADGVVPPEPTEDVLVARSNPVRSRG